MFKLFNPKPDVFFVSEWTVSKKVSTGTETKSSNPSDICNFSVMGPHLVSKTANDYQTDPACKQYNNQQQGKDSIAELCEGIEQNAPLYALVIKACVQKEKSTEVVGFAVYTTQENKIKTGIQLHHFTNGGLTSGYKIDFPNYVNLKQIKEPALIAKKASADKAEEKLLNDTKPNFLTRNNK